MKLWKKICSVITAYAVGISWNATCFASGENMAASSSITALSAESTSVWSLDKLVVAAEEAQHVEQTYCVYVSNAIASYGLQGAIQIPEATMELLQWPYGSETTSVYPYGISDGLYAAANQYMDNFSEVYEKNTSIFRFALAGMEVMQPTDTQVLLKLPIVIPDAETVLSIAQMYDVEYDTETEAYLFPIQWMEPGQDTTEYGVLEQFDYLDENGTNIFYDTVSLENGYIAVQVPMSLETTTTTDITTESSTATAADTTTTDAIISSTELTTSTMTTEWTTSTVEDTQTTEDITTTTEWATSTVEDTETTESITTTTEWLTSTTQGIVTTGYTTSQTQVITSTNTETTDTTNKEWYVLLQNPDVQQLWEGNSFYLMYSTNSKYLIWESTDETVASVDENGYVTIHKSGNVSIIAICYESPNVLDSVMLQIPDPSVTSTEMTTTEGNTTTTTTTTNTDDVEIFVKGDGDLNGTVDTFDAYQALLFYANISAGNEDFVLDKDPVNETRIEEQLNVDENSVIVTKDAFFILLYYAEKSSGNISITWDSIIR